MGAVDQERDHRRLARRGAQDPQAGDRLHRFGGVRQQFALARGDVLHADRLQVVHGCAQADEAGDVGGAGLELLRRVVEHRAVEADLPDHFPAAQERRHRRQVLAPRPQRAGAGGAAHLVAGDGVEVAADRGHVQLQVRRGLGAVDHGGDAAAAGLSADFAYRIDRAQHVGDVGQRQQLYLAGQGPVQRLQVQAAIGEDFGDPDAGAGAFGYQLPGHDVGVVLHPRHQDHVAGPEPRQRPGVGDQVDGEGGAAAQDQLVGAHAQEAGKLAAGRFVGLGGLGAQGVHGAADVGVVPAVEIVLGSDHRQRLLRGVGVVEVQQRLAVDLALQQREVGAYPCPVDAGVAVSRVAGSGCGRRPIQRGLGGRVHAPSPPSDAARAASRRASSRPRRSSS